MHQAWRLNHQAALNHISELEETIKKLEQRVASLLEDLRYAKHEYLGQNIWIEHGTDYHPWVVEPSGTVRTQTYEESDATFMRLFLKET